MYEKIQVEIGICNETRVLRGARATFVSGERGSCSDDKQNKNVRCGTHAMVNIEKEGEKCRRDREKSKSTETATDPI